MKKVMITGSNGVLGRNLVDYLDKYYHCDFELVLVDICDKQENASKYKTIIADIRDKEQIEQLMQDIDIVVHSASASPAYEDEKIYDIIINGTKNLLNCAFKTNNVERFIYISSTSVYGVADAIPIKETDEANPYDPYNKGKIKAEKICEQWRKKGKCVPILRPRSFLGPERLGTFAILYEWASEKRNFPMVGSGNNRYQLLDVEDLCQAIYLSMIGDKVKVNDVFNIGAKEFSTLKEDYQAVLDEVGYNKKIISFPVGPMMLALNILEKLNLSPFYKRLYKKLNKDYYVSIEKAENQLGYKPQYSNRDSLIRNYHWYMKNKDSNMYKEGEGNNNLWNQKIFKYVKYLF